MKIRILSDIHLEFEHTELNFSNCDLVVLAGDIHLNNKAIHWIHENIPEIPVLYVLGNHEFYKKAYPKLIDTLKEQVMDSNIHILENDMIHIKGVNFFGCTLWTDFALLGDPRLAGFECQQIMTDFKKIRLSPKYSKLRSIDLAIIHHKSVEWLKRSLFEHQGESNVIITHHAPDLRSVPLELRNDIISSAYASNLTELILEFQPDYWIHGHVHDSALYPINDCYIISNPKGYPKEQNVKFDPEFTLDLSLKGESKFKSLRHRMILNSALELFNGDSINAYRWMGKMNRALQNKPENMTNSMDEVQKVIDCVGRIEHGVFS